MSDHVLLRDMGTRIVQKRKQLNLSQDELAQRADVSPQLLSTAERGTKALRPENLLKISKALGVSTDFLLTGNINNSDYNIINEKLSKLPPEKIILIQSIIQQCIDLCDN